MGQLVGAVHGEHACVKQVPVLALQVELLQVAAEEVDLHIGLKEALEEMSFIGGLWGFLFFFVDFGEVDGLGWLLQLLQ